MFKYMKCREKPKRDTSAVSGWIALCRKRFEASGALWLVGEYGCGKTTVALEVIGDAHTSISYAELKSVKSVDEFISRKHSGTLFLDSPDSEWQGMAHFWERARNKFKIFVCSREPVGVPDWIDVIRMNGRNLRNEFTVGGPRDEFFKPKKMLESLLCTWGHVNPMERLGEPLEEHGFSWSMVHENYLDAVDLGGLARVSECLSRADCMDQHVHAGNWDLMPYFSINAIIEPALVVEHKLRGLRAGSSWTKYNHACMKANKARELEDLGFPLDTLQYFAQLVKRDPSLLREYKFTKKNVDTLKHLTWGRLTLKQVKEWKKNIDP